MDKPVSCRAGFILSLYSCTVHVYSVQVLDKIYIGPGAAGLRKYFNQSTKHHISQIGYLAYSFIIVRK